MADFASNPTFIAPVVAPYLGEATKVAMTEAQRANGFVPGQPVAVEHLNHEFNAITAGLERKLEAAALSNFTDETSGVAVSLNGVVWDATNAQFVAVGASGTILTSAHGREWDAQTSGVATNLEDVATNGSIIVVVGAGGVIRTSPTGVTWTARTSGTTDDLFGVTWSATLSLFVAVGDGGTILTSPDGITWTSRTSGSSAALLGVVAGSALLVVGGAAGELLTSPDGITWTARASGSGNFLSAAAYKDGTFVLAGNAGWLITSADGITWTPRTSGTAGDLRGAFATSRHFVVAGDGAILISRDGFTWYFADGLSGHTYMAAAWNNRVAAITASSGLVRNSHRLLNN